MKIWISNGTEHSLSNQLIDIYEILKKYLLITRVVDPKINELLKEEEKYTIDDYELNKVSGEIHKLVLLRDFSVYKLYNIIDVAKLLMCIDLEMRINKFCYYNLDNDIFEAIEKLDIVNKLIVAMYTVNQSKFKGTKVYEYVKEFKEFRNSYAHGKVQEIITKEVDKDEFKITKLRDNRIPKEKYEILLDTSLLHQITGLMKLCDKFIILINFLNKFNKYNEDIFETIHKEDIELFIREIKKMCNIIENNLELDNEIKHSLEVLLDRLLLRW